MSAKLLFCAAALLASAALVASFDLDFSDPQFVPKIKFIVGALDNELLRITCDSNNPIINQLENEAQFGVASNAQELRAMFASRCFSLLGETLSSVSIEMYSRNPIETPMHAIVEMSEITAAYLEEQLEDFFRESNIRQPFNAFNFLHSLLFGTSEQSNPAASCSTSDDESVRKPGLWSCILRRAKKQAVAHSDVLNPVRNPRLKKKLAAIKYSDAVKEALTTRDSALCNLLLGNDRFQYIFNAAKSIGAKLAETPAVHRLLEFERHHFHFSLYKLLLGVEVCRNLQSSLNN